MWIARFFKELSPDDFREFVVFIFGVLGFVYLFTVTFLPVPEGNEDVRTAGLTLVSTVIFGRMIIEFVSKRKKDDDNKEGSDIS